MKRARTQCNFHCYFCKSFCIHHRTRWTQKHSPNDDSFSHFQTMAVIKMHIAALVQKKRAYNVCVFNTKLRHNCRMNSFEFFMIKVVLFSLFVTNVVVVVLFFYLHFSCLTLSFCFAWIFYGEAMNGRCFEQWIMQFPLPSFISFLSPFFLHSVFKHWVKMKNSINFRTFLYEKGCCGNGNLLRQQITNFAISMIKCTKNGHLVRRFENLRIFVCNDATLYAKTVCRI